MGLLFTGKRCVLGGRGGHERVRRRMEWTEAEAWPTDEGMGMAKFHNFLSAE